MRHFEFSKDKIIMGPERKSAVIDEENRKIVAFHEGGHALVAMYTPGLFSLLRGQPFGSYRIAANPVHKATIMPRGQALGMVAQLPEKDELSWTRRQLTARLDVAMGGRVAEEIIFGEDFVTSGAASDLDNATKVAKAMVLKYGMSSKVGPLFHRDEDLEQLSPQVRYDIDCEIKSLIEAARIRAQNVLRNHKEELHRLAAALLEYETLTREEIELAMKGKLPVRRSIAVRDIEAQAG